MAYVKLDCGILDSSLWLEREQREIFITALLMATPYELIKPLKTIQVDSLERGDYIVPPGWYGFVEAAGPGLIARALVERSVGMIALKALASPDLQSRSSEHDGRRLVRVQGGFIVLNYQAYRDKDHTAAERARRYRARKRNLTHHHGAVTLPSRDAPVIGRNVTEAEAEAEAEAEVNSNPSPAPHRGAISEGMVVLIQELGFSIYERPMLQHATQIEQLGALEITKRPQWKEEKDTILAFAKRCRPEDKRFYLPRSLHSLLSNWSETLDKARTYKPHETNHKHNPRNDGVAVGPTDYGEAAKRKLAKQALEARNRGET